MLYYFQDQHYHRLTQQYIEKHTPYYLVDILGIGGYGVAYLIVHPETEQQYVLKRLKAKHRKKTTAHQKFHQEICIMKSFNSLYFPAIVTNGQISDLPFYIMEYIEGKTFEQAIFHENQVFSITTSLDITKQLLEIVIFMHHHGIVHRDLRIPNILLQNGMLRVIDFGLATYQQENVQLQKIKNPKKAENYISDLYFVGHFLLFLLYSNYTPTTRRERSWQQELHLPDYVIHYIERLLLIRHPFSSAKHALTSMPIV